MKRFTLKARCLVKTAALATWRIITGNQPSPDNLNRAENRPNRIWAKYHFDQLMLSWTT